MFNPEDVKKYVVHVGPTDATFVSLTDYNQLLQLYWDAVGALTSQVLSAKGISDELD